MNEFAEPKCPECGKSSFSYKVVVSNNYLRKTKESIDAIKEKIKQQEGDNRKIATPDMQGRLKTAKKRLNQIIANSTDNGYGLIFFCLHCGYIIGTGGRSQDPRDGSWHYES